MAFRLGIIISEDYEDLEMELSVLCLSVMRWSQCLSHNNERPWMPGWTLVTLALQMMTKTSYLPVKICHAHESCCKLMTSV